MPAHTNNVELRFTMHTNDFTQNHYHLITGATGLLGTYLLRDMLRDGHRLVVVARASRKESARARINSILTRWEQETGENFVRPVVIEGNLTDENWWLDSVDWIAENCKSVINCAASLTFYGSKESEPWTTNIDGTRQILELCRRTGIDTLHHFSTAYVAGSYREVFTENMLNVGQELRNDYEQSKFQSETMVRGADWIRSLTVYRPSIVVGDSQTYKTCTYHGYYAVLKLAHTLVNRLTLGSTSGRRLLGALGMNGSEYKNFVPVDWVSEVFCTVFANEKLYGRTYHLTNNNPTPINEMVDTIQEAVETMSTLADNGDSLLADEDWFMRNYADQVGIYQNYLDDDPHFDSANTESVEPHPCPKVDRGMMLKLADFAISNRFGKPSPKPIQVEVDVQSVLEVIADDYPAVIEPTGDVFGLCVTGNGGGEWTLRYHNGCWSLQNGIAASLNNIVTLDTKKVLEEANNLSQTVKNYMTDLLNRIHQNINRPQIMNLFDMPKESVVESVM
ncbi:MAG: SDR family oxidoreductase [Planctomycetaceae bacterium]|nr:SDR family oxidoreductase [Planctomycetaceae bacterium]